ncbi:MAG: hypothetical protein ACYDHP_00550 [Ferrimicrobium sp.]
MDASARGLGVGVILGLVRVVDAVSYVIGGVAGLGGVAAIFGAAGRVSSLRTALVISQQTIGAQAQRIQLLEVQNAEQGAMVAELNTRVNQLDTVLSELVKRGVVFQSSAPRPPNPPRKRPPRTPRKDPNNG